jgi:hypothetical protein
VDRDSLLIGTALGFLLAMGAVMFYIYIRNRFLREIGVE